MLDKGFFVLKNIEGDDFMPVVNVSIQVIPKVPDEQTYYVVDKVIEYIDSCNVKYEVGPMETTMEGDLDTLLNIVKEVQEICVKEGAY